MPKYKKNKRRRRHTIFKFRRPDEYVEMTPSDSEDKASKVKKASFKIHNGKKQINKLKRLIFLGVFLSVALVIILVSLLSPTGIAEMYKNFSATFSLNSKLPIELYGTETYNVSVHNNYFCLLSDTDFSTISNNGKVSFRDNHGFSSPIMCDSEARTLIFDQNGKGVRIYNAEGLLHSFDYTNSIYAADIARNGYFAVAGKAENYTSMVTVYNKNGDMIYEWYCPEEIINSVAVAPDGKSVAVGTVSVSDGEFTGKIYVLKYNSADAVYKKEYDDKIIYAINSVTRKNFAVVFENSCDIISWKDYSAVTYNSEYDVNFVRATAKRIAIASSRESNDGNYEFNVYNNSKKLVFSFKFDGHINDFQIRKNNIYILSGNSVYLINSDGEIAKTGTANFGTVKIIPVSSSSCLAVGHNSVTKISLQ